jgi:hypothetical protein
LPASGVEEAVDARRLTGPMVLALLTAACGGAAASAGGPRDDSTSPVTIVDPGHADVTATISGGSPAFRAVVRRALAGLGPTIITRVSVVPAENRYRPVPAGGLRVAIEYPAAHHRFDAAANYAGWQAELLAGAVRDAAERQSLGPLIWYDSPMVGSRIWPSPPAADAGDPSPAGLIRRAQLAARLTDADVANLTVLRPRSAAISIELRVHDPAAFLKHRLTDFVGRAFLPGGGAGWYWQLDDARGTAVAVGSSSPRTGSSGGWVEPRLLGCWDPALSRPFGGRPPPPCPAG